MQLKKIIAGLLCSPFIGKVIVVLFNKKIPSLRNFEYRFSVPVHHSSPIIHASIFWGIYESAEIRLIKKYLRSDLPVIELGASLGIVSSFIIKQLKRGVSLKVVEANPNLITTIHSNLERHNVSNVQYEIINKALGYSDNYIHMQLSSDNTASHVVRSEKPVGDFVKVACVRLSTLISLHPYTLVCDIEGSEIEIIMNDDEALKKCTQLFIELHDTTYKGVFYKSIELKGLLEQRGFICQKKDGNVYYFERQ